MPLLWDEIRASRASGAWAGAEPSARLDGGGATRRRRYYGPPTGRLLRAAQSAMTKSPTRLRSVRPRPRCHRGQAGRRRRNGRSHAEHGSEGHGGRRGNVQETRDLPDMGLVILGTWYGAPAPPATYGESRRKAVSRALMLRRSVVWGPGPATPGVEGCEDVERPAECQGCRGCPRMRPMRDSCSLMLALYAATFSLSCARRKRIAMTDGPRLQHC